MSKNSGIESFLGLSVPQDDQCMNLNGQTYTLWHHKRDLLVIKAVHVERLFTLDLKRNGRQINQQSEKYI